MTPGNVRVLWYYGMCLCCGDGAIRSVACLGEVAPCEKCEMGFRMVLGRRVLWDGADGTRNDRYESAVRPVGKKDRTSHQSRASDSEIRDLADPGQDRSPTLSEEELRWLFGYDTGTGPMP